MFGFDLKKVLSIGLLCAISQVGLCANWVYLGNNKEFKIYVDTDSIKTYSDNYSTSRSGNFRSAWFKYEFNKPQKLDNGKEYIKSRVKWVMACHLDKIINESGTTYNKQGNYVDSYTQKVTSILANEWDSVIPDTIGEIMFNHVCK